MWTLNSTTGQRRNQKGNLKLSGNFLVVQWLGLSAFTGECVGLIAGCETNIQKAQPNKIISKQ